MQRGLSLVVPLHNCRASWAGPSDRCTSSTWGFSTTIGYDRGAVSLLISGAFGAFGTTGASHRCRVKDSWRHLTQGFSSAAWRSPWSFWRGLQVANFLLHSGSFWGRFCGRSVDLFFRFVSWIEVICRWRVFLDDSDQHTVTGWDFVIRFSGAASWEALPHGAPDSAEFIIIPLWHFRLRFVRIDSWAHKRNPFTGSLCPFSTGLILLHRHIYLLDDPPLLIYSLQSLLLHVLICLFPCGCSCTLHKLFPAGSIFLSWPVLPASIFTVSLRRRRARVLGGRGEIKNWQVLLPSSNGVWVCCSCFSSRRTDSPSDFWRLLHHAAYLAAAWAKPDLKVLLLFKNRALGLCLQFSDKGVCNKKNAGLTKHHFNSGTKLLQQPHRFKFLYQITIIILEDNLKLSSCYKFMNIYLVLLQDSAQTPDHGRFVWCC